MPNFMLSKHKGDGPVPPAQLAFVGRKMRNDLHHLVLSAFKESGLTQSELAARMGVDKAQVSRQLGAPGNWTIDTVAKLLFAINGSYIVAVTVDPDKPGLANFTEPAWLQGRLPPLPVHEAANSVIVTISPNHQEGNVKHPRYATPQPENGSVTKIVERTPA